MGVTCSNFSGAQVHLPRVSRYQSKGLRPPIRRAEVFEAVANGNLAELERLIERDGQFVNISGSDGRTPLHLACAEGHAKIVDYLLAKQANPNTQDRWGTEPLKEAITHGHIEVVEILARAGVTLSKDSAEDLEYKLLQCVSAGDFPKVKALVESGVSAQAVDYDQRSALHLAASIGSVEMLDFLIAKGANVHCTDRWGATALSDAILGKHAAAQQTLRAAGLTLAMPGTAERTESSGETELCSERSTVKNTKGGSVSSSVSWSEQRTTTNSIMEAAATGNVAELRRLIDDGADANAADYDQRTPLHLCCSEGFLDAVLFLIAAGANPAARDRWGSEPFVDAVSHGHVAVAEAMVAAGVRLSAEAAAEAASGLLCQRAAAGDAAAVAALLAAGAPANARDFDGRSALHAAAADGRTEAAELLLAAGADPSAVDRCGETPLTLAISGCHLEVQRLLQDAGARLCYTELRPHPRRRRLGSVSGLEAAPPGMIEARLAGREAEPVAHESVGVFFSDIVGFQALGDEMDGARLGDLLNRLFSKFDHLAELHGVQKVDVIGDAYLAATNFSTAQPGDYAARLARFALAAAAAARETAIDASAAAAAPGGGGETVTIRVGLHCGPVSGTLLGTTNLKYTLMGDTVNTASRMESTSLPGRVQCSQPFAAALAQQAPDVVVEPREGGAEVKGKGHMTTYWVVSQRLPDRVWTRRQST